MADCDGTSAHDLTPAAFTAEGTESHRSQIDEAKATANASAATVDSPAHPVFVFSYLANLSLVTANASTFVFADWVSWLSRQSSSSMTYSEELPGRVIQYGLLAAMTGRMMLGRSIDRFGVRRVWQTMCFLGLCGVLIFTFQRTLSPWVYAGRILFATGLAGMFTCGNFHIQSVVDEHRRTEFIGLVGSSGFVGMILGSQLADFLRWITNHNPDVFFPTLFRIALVLVTAHMVLLSLATRTAAEPLRQQIRPSLIRLTRQYWPGMVTVVSMMMGVVFTVPSVFLVRFNLHENFGGIAVYWTTYALAAFTFRVQTAALSQRIGRYRLIFIGLMAQGLGLWSLLPVSAWWHLLPSALLCGLGHALLFPSIVSLGSGRFPPEYRGSGINLILGCLDLGAAISAPLLGRIIDLPRFDGAGFRPMFFVAGSLPILVAIVWIVLNHRSEDLEMRNPSS